MKKHLGTMALAVMLTGVIAAPFAAGMTRDVSSSKMPAVTTPNTYNPNAPVNGRNSFTQSQVTERLGKAGYSNIRDLKKGADGIWRGMADKNGASMNVMFDYQGNITTGTSSSMPM